MPLQLQGGGDMSLMKNFNTAAIRQGFIIDNVSIAWARLVLGGGMCWLDLHVQQ